MFGFAVLHTLLTQTPHLPSPNKTLLQEMKSKQRMRESPNVVPTPTLFPCSPITPSRGKTDKREQKRNNSSQKLRTMVLRVASDASMQMRLTVLLPVANAPAFYHSEPLRRLRHCSGDSSLLRFGRASTSSFRLLSCTRLDTALLQPERWMLFNEVYS